MLSVLDDRGTDGATGVVDPEIGGDVAEEAPEVAAAMTARARFNIDGPSASGYCYSDGVRCCRIVRGMPKNSLSMRCFRHPACSFLLPLRLAPTDDELLEWLFEVEVPDRALSAAAHALEAQRLAALHIARANRWREPPPAAKANGRRGRGRGRV